MTDNTKSKTPPAPMPYFEPKRRRPRFRPIEGRRSDTSRAGVLALTERDLDILLAVATHRFLNSGQIARLFHGGRTKARLTELFHAQYLDRPLRQRDLKIRNGELMPGGLPMVYALTTDGARLLAEAGKLPPTATRRNWARDNSDASRFYIGHTLAIANLRIALDESAAHQPNVTLRHDRELAKTIPRDFQKHPGRAFSMTTSIIENGRRDVQTVDCDAAFELDDTAQRRRAHFLTEIDMGTMPVIRWGMIDDPERPGRKIKAPSRKGTSIMRKLITYERAYDLELHKTLFGWPGFRVLILTTTAARVTSITEAIAMLNGGKGSKLFLVGTNDATNGDLLKHEFVDGWGHKKLC